MNNSCKSLINKIKIISVFKYLVLIFAFLLINVFNRSQFVNADEISWSYGSTNDKAITIIVTGCVNGIGELDINLSTAQGNTIGLYSNSDNPSKSVIITIHRDGTYSASWRKVTTGLNCSPSTSNDSQVKYDSGSITGLSDEAKKQTMDIIVTTSGLSSLNETFQIYKNYFMTKNFELTDVGDGSNPFKYKVEFLGIGGYSENTGAAYNYLYYNWEQYASSSFPTYTTQSCSYDAIINGTATPLMGRIETTAGTSEVTVSLPSNYYESVPKVWRLTVCARDVFETLYMEKVELDKQPPEFSGFSSDITPTIFSKSHTVTINYVDKINEVEKIYYCWSTINTSCDSEYQLGSITNNSVTIEESSLDGIYYLLTYGVDNLGNSGISNPYSIAFHFDNTPPEMISIIQNGDSTWKKSHQVTVKYEDKYNDVIDLYYCWTTSSTCTDNTFDVILFEDEASKSISHIFNKSSLGGIYYLKLYAMDAIGNYSEIITTEAFYFDNTAPIFASITPDGDSGWEKSHEVTIAYNDVHTYVSTIYYCWSTNNSNCTSSYSPIGAISNSATITQQFLDGEYYLLTYAVDAVGNSSAGNINVSEVFAFDNTAPILSIITPDGNNQKKSTHTVTIKYTDSHTTVSAIYYCWSQKESLCTTTFTEKSATDNEITITKSSLNGKYYLISYGQDSVGNNNKIAFDVSSNYFNFINYSNDFDYSSGSLSYKVVENDDVKDNISDKFTFIIEDYDAIGICVYAFQTGTRVENGSFDNPIVNAYYDGLCDLVRYDGVIPDFVYEYEGIDAVFETDESMIWDYHYEEGVPLTILIFTFYEIDIEIQTYDVHAEGIYLNVEAPELSEYTWDTEDTTTDAHKVTFKFDEYIESITYCLSRTNDPNSSTCLRSSATVVKDITTISSRTTTISLTIKNNLFDPEITEYYLFISATDVVGNKSDLFLPFNKKLKFIQKEYIYELSMSEADDIDDHVSKSFTFTIADTKAVELCYAVIGVYYDIYFTSMPIGGGLNATKGINCTNGLYANYNMGILTSKNHSTTSLSTTDYNTITLSGDDYEEGVWYLHVIAMYSSTDTSDYKHTYINLKFDTTAPIKNSITFLTEELRSEHMYGSWWQYQDVKIKFNEGISYAAWCVRTTSQSSCTPQNSQTFSDFPTTIDIRFTAPATGTYYGMVRVKDKQNNSIDFKVTNTDGSDHLLYFDYTPPVISNDNYHIHDGEGYYDFWYGVVSDNSQLKISFDDEHSGERNIIYCWAETTDKCTTPWMASLTTWYILLYSHEGVELDIPAGDYYLRLYTLDYAMNQSEIVVSKYPFPLSEYENEDVYVAKNDRDVYFTNMEDAFNQTNYGGTITLLKDLDNIGATGAYEYILDLNGKNIYDDTMHMPDSPVIENNGKLTIIGNGSITARYKSDILINNGTLIVGGNVQIDAIQGSGTTIIKENANISVIDSSNGPTVISYGGAVGEIYSYISLGYYSHVNLQMYGGHIERIQLQGRYESNIVMTGGTIDSITASCYWDIGDDDSTYADDTMYCSNYINIKSGYVGSIDTFGINPVITLGSNDGFINPEDPKIGEFHSSRAEDWTYTGVYYTQMYLYDGTVGYCTRVSIYDDPGTMPCHGVSAEDGFSSNLINPYDEDVASLIYYEDCIFGSTQEGCQAFYELQTYEYAIIPLYKAKNNSNIFFNSLQDAIDSTNNGGTITVLKNIDIASYSQYLGLIHIASSQSLTINLNGYTISTSLMSPIIHNEGNLIIYGGTLRTSGPYDSAVIYNSNTISLNDINIYAGVGVGILTSYDNLSKTITLSNNVRMTGQLGIVLDGVPTGSNPITDSYLNLNGSSINVNQTAIYSDTFGTKKWITNIHSGNYNSLYTNAIIANKNSEIAILGGELQADDIAISCRECSLNIGNSNIFPPIKTNPIIRGNDVGIDSTTSDIGNIYGGMIIGNNGACSASNGCSDYFVPVSDYKIYEDDKKAFLVIASFVGSVTINPNGTGGVFVEGTLEIEITSNTENTTDILYCWSTTASCNQYDKKPAVVNKITISTVGICGRYFLFIKVQDAWGNISTNTIVSNEYLLCVVHNVNKDIYYSDIQSAIDDSNSGNIIEILSNIVITTGIYIESNDNITLNLNGYTLSCSIADCGTYSSDKHTFGVTVTMIDYSVVEDPIQMEYIQVPIITNFGTLNLIGSGGIVRFIEDYTYILDVHTHIYHAGTKLTTENLTIQNGAVGIYIRPSDSTANITEINENTTITDVNFGVYLYSSIMESSSGALSISWAHTLNINNANIYGHWSAIFYDDSVDTDLDNDGDGDVDIGSYTINFNSGKLSSGLRTVELMGPSTFSMNGGEIEGPIGIYYHFATGIYGKDINIVNGTITAEEYGIYCFVCSIVVGHVDDDFPSTEVPLIDSENVGIHNSVDAGGKVSYFYSGIVKGATTACTIDLYSNTNNCNDSFNSRENFYIYDAGIEAYLVAINITIDIDFDPMGWASFVKSIDIVVTFDSTYPIVSVDYCWSTSSDECSESYIRYPNTISNNTITLNSGTRAGKYYLFIKAIDSRANESSVKKSSIYYLGVAEIVDSNNLNKNYYHTIQEAINNVGSDEKVQILTNTSENFAIAKSKIVIIELNGYTISEESSVKPIIDNMGTLNLYGRGTINHTSSVSDPTINNSGTLNIENVNIKANGYYAINNTSVLNVSNTDSCIYSTNMAAIVSTGGTLTIERGCIIGSIGIVLNGVSETELGNIGNVDNLLIIGTNGLGVSLLNNSRITFNGGKIFSKTDTSPLYSTNTYISIPENYIWIGEDAKTTLNSSYCGVTFNLNGYLTYIIIEPDKPVAMNDSNEFFLTMQLAVDGTDSGGSIIVLISNAMNFSIPTAKSLILCLNGQSLSGIITVNGVLEIEDIDSFENGGFINEFKVSGNVIIDGTDILVEHVLIESGSVTLNNGSIINNTDTAIDLINGSMIVNGGTIQGKNHSILIENGSFSMSNGEIHGTVYIYLEYGTAGNTININISGGSINSTGEAGIHLNGPNASKFTLTVKITGGEIIGQKYGVYIPCYGELNAEIGDSTGATGGPTILSLNDSSDSYGVYLSSANSFKLYNSNIGTMYLSDIQNVHIDKNDDYLLDLELRRSNIVVINNGYIYLYSTDSNVTINNGIFKSISIMGGTITVYNGVIQYIGFFIEGTITLNGGTISNEFAETQTTAVIEMRFGGNLNVHSGVTIKNFTPNGSAIYVLAGFDVTINIDTNVEFYSTVSGGQGITFASSELTSQKNGDVTLNINGKIEADSFGIVASGQFNSFNLNLGDKGTTSVKSNTGPAIFLDIEAVSEEDGNSPTVPTFNVNQNVTLKGGTTMTNYIVDNLQNIETALDTKLACANGTPRYSYCYRDDVIYNTNGYGEYTSKSGNLYTTTYVSSVAQIGSTKYNTLSAAINAASNNATIKLIGNITEKAITISKNITLDLNGKILSNFISSMPYASNETFDFITISKGFTLTLKDSSTGGQIQILTATYSNSNVGLDIKGINADNHHQLNILDNYYIQIAESNGISALSLISGSLIGNSVETMKITPTINDSTINLSFENSTNKAITLYLRIGDNEEEISCNTTSCNSIDILNSNFKFFFNAIHEDLISIKFSNSTQLELRKVNLNIVPTFIGDDGSFGREISNGTYTISTNGKVIIISGSVPNSQSVTDSLNDNFKQILFGPTTINTDIITTFEIGLGSMSSSSDQNNISISYYYMNINDAYTSSYSYFSGTTFNFEEMPYIIIYDYSPKLTTLSQAVSLATTCEYGSECGISTLSFVDYTGFEVNKVSNVITLNGNVVDEIDSTVLGTYVVTTVATDRFGYISKPIVRTFEIKDTVAPIVKINNETLTIKEGESFDDLMDIEVSDNYDNHLTVERIDNNINTSKAGIYKLGYKVVDSNGNATIVYRTLIVEKIPNFKVLYSLTALMAFAVVIFVCFVIIKKDRY